MTNKVVQITERAKQTATELKDRLRNLTASVSSLSEERQIPAIVTPLTNTPSASPNNTGAIDSEPQPTTEITPRRLQYTNNEAALLLFDSEETMSVSKTFEQILALVQAQLLILGETLQPTKTPTHVQVWSLQQALANVLADIACHLSRAGLAWLIEREDAYKIRLKDNNSKLPTFPAFPVEPASNDAVIYKKYERKQQNYNHIHYYDRICIQTYREYFIDKFRQLEEVPGHAPANVTARDYYNFLINKLGKQLNKETEFETISKRINDIPYRSNPNEPMGVFRTVQTLHSLTVDLGYPDAFTDAQIKALMLAKFKKSGHSKSKLKKLQADWNGETVQTLRNFIEYWCDELEELYENGDTGDEDATAHFTSEMIDAVIDEATARVRDEIQPAEPPPPAPTPAPVPAPAPAPAPTETACMTTTGVELNTLAQMLATAMQPLINAQGGRGNGGGRFGGGRGRGGNGGNNGQVQSKGQFNKYCFSG